MATSSLQTIELQVDGSPIAVDAIEGSEALSTISSLRAYCRDRKEDAKDVDALLGKPFTLKITTKNREDAFRHGIVWSALVSAQDEWTTYELDLRPEVALLCVGCDSYVFQDMTVKDIVSDVLERGGIPVDHTRWANSAAPPKRVYTAQLVESDWAFVERILADEGLYYFFEHTADATTVVFTDASADSPDVPGTASFKAPQQSGLMVAYDTVANITMRALVTSDKVHLRDYDPKKPKTQLDVEHAEGDGKYEVYDYPGRFTDPAVGKSRAKIAAEGFRSARKRVLGAVTTARMAPGHAFTIVDHLTDAVNAKYVCVDTQWGMSAAGTIELKWSGIPEDLAYRGTSLERIRLMPGPQTGVMAGPPGEELHTSDTGDIRVQFYWDRKGARDDKASTFMRVGQFALGGSMVRPRIGWDLLVEHHQGEADAPFVLTHLYDGEHPPPYALPANKTRTAWQTATTPGGGSANEVRFEDKAGSEEMFLNASKDMAVTVGDSKGKKVGVDHTHDIGANHQVKVGSNHTIGVKTDQTVKVGATETVTVTGDRATAIAGGETATVGAAKTVTTTGGHTLDANGGRSVTVGASMMDIAALGVSRAVLGSCSVTVGAAWISAAATGLSNATLGSSAETVGAAKLQLGGGGVKLNVKGALAETVGGAYINLPGGNSGESATGSLTINVGGAFIGNAPDILIEAESEIVFTVGGSSLTVKSGSIEVKSPSLASPGATIAKDGSAVHHNP